MVGSTGAPCSQACFRSPEATGRQTIAQLGPSTQTQMWRLPSQWQTWIFSRSQMSSILILVAPALLVVEVSRANAPNGAPAATMAIVAITMVLVRLLNIRYLQSGGWTIPNARSVRLNRV